MIIDFAGYFPLVPLSFIFFAIPSIFPHWFGLLWVTYLSLQTGDLPFIFFNLGEVSHLKCFDLLQLLHMLLFQGKKKKNMKSENRRARMVRESVGGPRMGMTSCEVRRPKHRPHSWLPDQDKERKNKLWMPGWLWIARTSLLGMHSGTAAQPLWKGGAVLIKITYTY